MALEALRGRLLRQNKAQSSSKQDSPSGYTNRGRSFERNKNMEASGDEYGKTDDFAYLKIC